MTVYVVVGWNEWDDGWHVVGVYRDREKALDVCDGLNASDSDGFRYEVDPRPLQ